MKISVITVNYNNKDGLDKTLRSVVNQTCKDFEYVVIDGNSSDGSKTIIEEYSDQINYWVSEPDKGIYNAMNKGILAANGEYVLFLNSGDTFYDETSLARAMPFLNDGDIITGITDLVEEDRRILVKSPQSLSFKQMFRYSIDHPSSFIKRNLFIEIGLYDESFKIISDWKWFTIALAKHHALYKSIPEIISTFYFDGVSSLPENREKLLAERKKVLEQEFPFFITDYKELIDYEEDAKNFRKIKNSGWVKLGRKIGLMKNVRF